YGGVFPLGGGPRGPYGGRPPFLGGGVFFSPGAPGWGGGHLPGRLGGARLPLGVGGGGVVVLARVLPTDPFPGGRTRAPWEGTHAPRRWASTASCAPPAARSACWSADS